MNLIPQLLGIHIPQSLTMGPVTSTIISALFLITGGFAAFTMMSLQGGRKIKNPKRIILIHKISGWVFTALFAVMFIFMIQRVEDYWEESSPRIALHVALAVGLLFLLTIKILIPKVFRGLSKHLLPIGLLVYFTGFTLVGISGGYYLVRVAKGTPYISHVELPEHLRELRIGKELFITKCSICHALKEIMAPRSPESWETVVNEMVKLAEPRINPDEAAQILHYLTETHVPEPFEGPADASLLEKHCLPCHDALEIFKDSHTRASWTEVVEKMNGYSPDIVPEYKIEEIVEYLLVHQDG